MYYRRLPEGQDLLDNTIEQQQIQSSHPNSQHQTYNYRGGYGNMHWTSRNEWRDVVLPAMPLSHLYTQSMSYMIRVLEPDQHYEAKVQAR